VNAAERKVMERVYGVVNAMTAKRTRDQQQAAAEGEGL
jgi:hypothetical protein